MQIIQTIHGHSPNDDCVPPTIRPLGATCLFPQTTFHHLLIVPIHKSFFYANYFKISLINYSPNFVPYKGFAVVDDKVVVDLIVVVEGVVDVVEDVVVVVEDVVVEGVVVEGVVIEVVVVDIVTFAGVDFDVEVDDCIVDVKVVCEVCGVVVDVDADSFIDVGDFIVDVFVVGEIGDLVVDDDVCDDVGGDVVDDEIVFEVEEGSEIVDNVVNKVFFEFDVELDAELDSEVWFGMVNLVDSGDCVVTGTGFEILSNSFVIVILIAVEVDDKVEVGICVVGVWVVGCVSLIVFIVDDPFVIEEMEEFFSEAILIVVMFES